MILYDGIITVDARSVSDMLSIVYYFGMSAFRDVYILFGLLLIASIDIACTS